jgi:hypothetical protein
MSVDLGLAAFPLDTFQNVMARELGGWDYNDLWASNLQMSAPLPYSAPLPFNSEALSLPYSATARCTLHLASAVLEPTMASATFTLLLYDSGIQVRMCCMLL